MDAERQKIVDKQYARNKDIPQFRTYYQEYADLCALVGAYHMRRLKEGHRPPATYIVDMVPHETKYGSFSDYLASVGSFGRRISVIEKFAEGLRQSFTCSSVELVDDQGPFGLKAKEVVERVRIEGEPIHQHPSNFAYLFKLNGGITTASRTIAQLVAIFSGLAANEKYARYFASQSTLDYVVAASVACSKIGISSLVIGELDSLIGLGESGSFKLIDLDSRPTGLDRGSLSGLGVGAVLGCPAAMKPSQDCRSFLEAQGCGLKQTVVEQFARIAYDSYHATVLPWYQDLRWYKKRLRIAKKDRRILEGRILE